MAISLKDMESVLVRTGCKTVQKIDKVSLYRLSGKKKFLFYIEKKASAPKVVLHPAISIYDDVLSAISGVNRHSQTYFNEDMNRFPERINDGLTPTHYGIGYLFDNNLALEEFLSKLVDIVNTTETSVW